MELEQSVSTRLVAGSSPVADTIRSDLVEDKRVERIIEYEKGNGVI